MVKMVLMVGGLIAGIVACGAANSPVLADSPVGANAWNGYYLGAFVGAARNNTRQSLSSSGLGGTLDDIEASDPGFLGYSFSGASAATMSGAGQAQSTTFLGGVVVGGNHRSGSTMYGWEADWMSLHAGGTSSYSNNASVTYDYSWPPGETDNVSTDVRLRTRANWLSTLRARVGLLATPNILLTVSGGPAFSIVSTRADVTQTWVNGLYGEPTWNSPYKLTSSKDTFKVGYALGFGAEYMVTPNWVVKGDVIHYDLGTTKTTGAPLVVNADYYGDPLQFAASANMKTRLDGTLFRVGLSYMLGQ